MKFNTNWLLKFYTDINFFKAGKEQLKIYSNIVPFDKKKRSKGERKIKEDEKNIL